MQIWAVLACLQWKMTFLLSENVQKGQYLSSHPYGLQQKWFQILRRTARGHVAKGHKHQKKKNGAKISYVPILTYLHFLRGSCIPNDNVRKKHNFAHLAARFSESFYVVIQNTMIVERMQLWAKEIQGGCFKNFDGKFASNINFLSGNFRKGAFLARIKPRNTWIWFEFKAVSVWKRGNFC